MCVGSFRGGENTHGPVCVPHSTCGKLCTVDVYQKKHKMCSRNGSKSPQEEGGSKSGLQCPVLFPEAVRNPDATEIALLAPFPLEIPFVLRVLPRSVGHSRFSGMKIYFQGGAPNCLLAPNQLPSHSPAFGTARFSPEPREGGTGVRSSQRLAFLREVTQFLGSSEYKGGLRDRDS